jgi:protein-S-isoprenylcysteine O-methyltransferase Ste14
MKDSRLKFFVILAVSAVIGAIAGSVLVVVGPHATTKDLFQPLRPSMGLYVLFSLYWTIAARNSAPVKSSEHWASTMFHQVLLGVALLLLFLRVPGLTGRWLPISPLFLPLGLLIQAGAIMLAIWARRHLGSNWSAEISAKVDHQLIRSGPYRLLRHPIYTAVFGIHIGIAIASGEWHALAGIIVMSFAYWRKIRLEERNLREVFGTEYEAFRRESWALIPWLV